MTRISFDNRIPLISFASAIAVGSAKIACAAGTQCVQGQTTAPVAGSCPAGSYCAGACVECEIIMRSISNAALCVINIMIFTQFAIGRLFIF